jgi:hypothetical protein
MAEVVNVIFAFVVVFFVIRWIFSKCTSVNKWMRCNTLKVKILADTQWGVL